jgi:hypothetical protein
LTGQETKSTTELTEGTEDEKFQEQNVLGVLGG